jgi:glycosyltransferase involved in cell wall biosynthesis
MKVSVIIPAYNAGPFVGEAIDSLLNQTHRDVEVIVIDDGSTDDTAVQVGAYVIAGQPVTYIYQQNHGSAGAARNTALRYAAGEYIAFLDADDRAHPARMAAQVEFLETHADAGAVYTDYRNFRGTTFEASHFTTCPVIRARLDGRLSVVLPSFEARDILLEENYALPSTCMIRREVLTSVPGFSTVKGGEDILFAYQVAQRWAIGLIDIVGAERRLHDSNVSGGANPFPYMEAQLLSRELMATTEESQLLREKIAAWLRRRQRHIAVEYAKRDRIREAFAASLASRDYALLMRTAILAVLPRKFAGGKKKPSGIPDGVAAE